MKQLFENWRRYINEEVKQFAMGDTHGNFINDNPEATIEAFQRLGADEKVLSIISKYIENDFPHQDLNQIVAVLAGAKPMWYGAMVNLTNWKEPDMDCYDNLPRSSEPTPVLQENVCPPIDIGKFILENAHKAGLSYEPVPVDQVVFGKPESVTAAAQEANRIGNPNNADAQFHKVMGRALGYPEEEIEAFINDPAMKT